MKNSKQVCIANRSLSPDLLRKMDAYWRAANYLSVSQIYLYDNPLLKREHIKPRLLGHWGTTPGLNLIYVHLNRVITRRMIDHKNYIDQHGEDLLEIRNWKWIQPRKSKTR